MSMKRGGVLWDGDIAIHGGGNEVEGCSIEGALASGYIHKYAK
jgi:hypothetical protein